MSTEVLACPSCRAPGASGPDANDEYYCGYCGTRFRRAAAAAPVAPVVVHVTPGSGQPRATLVLALIAILVMGLGVSGAVLWAGSKPVAEPSKPTPARAASGSASGSGQAAPSEPTKIAPRTSVQISAPAAVKPEPEAPASATFELHRTQSGYKSSYYALGFVENTSPFVINKPKVIAVLLDAEGQEISTDFGFAKRDALGPGDRSPIKILISDPPAHESVRYEIVVRKASYVPEQVEGLRVEPSEPRRAKFGDNRWEVEGKVFNGGTQGAKFVSVEILALGADGKLVGVDSTFADAEVLAPEGWARFSTTSFTAADEIDHFEFSASGRPAG